MESKAERPVTEVVAALIYDKDKLLICQRPAHKGCGLLWEFVGGKVEPGETREQALVRECREELGIIVSVSNMLTQVTHVYPDITVHLTLFNVTIAAGIPQKLEHADIRWVRPRELDEFPFCPADEEIVKNLMEKSKAAQYKRYNKLVRDKIPQVIAAKGETCITEVLAAAAYQSALEEKLKEECNEYFESKEPEELADILEVIYAIAAAQGINKAQLETLRIGKFQARGGFEKRLLLKEVWEEKFA